MMKNQLYLNKLQKNREWRKNNPEKFKISRDNWKRNNLERYRQLQRNWEIKNRLNRENRKDLKKMFTKIKEKTEETYYQRNKERHRIWTKNWARKNKDRINEYKRRREVKKRNVVENFSNQEWKKKLLNTKGICPKCEKYIGLDKLTIDHTPPISKVPIGFVYIIDHVSPLCISCNSIKGNRYETQKERVTSDSLL